ncbi:MAG TPA: hypothetical protein VJ183_05115 [Chloroflexia bacterium]|nr:hypothetical protein [Chloroflexia bacterium]
MSQFTTQPHYHTTPGTEGNHQEPVAAQGHRHPTLQPNAPVGAWRRHAPTPAPYHP